jgi:uncharacterized Zn ribbon protein
MAINPCSKCGSRSTYQEADATACMMCGNREYPIIISKTTDEEEEGEDVKKACVNCGRTMSIKKKGMCATCSGAAENAVGTETKDQALAQIKEKILSGKLQKGGGRGIPRKKPERAEKTGLEPEAEAVAYRTLPEWGDLGKRTPDPLTIPVTIRLTIEVVVRP